LKHTLPTPLIPLGTQLFDTGKNNTLPSVSDLNNHVQQQIVYLKRYPDIKIDPYGYQNDYYFTMNKSDWENNYKNLQDYNTEIRHPIYYNNEEYTIQRFKRGDLMNQFDQKAIQHYKKLEKRLPRKGVKLIYDYIQSILIKYRFFINYPFLKILHKALEYSQTFCCSTVLVFIHDGIAFTQSVVACLDFLLLLYNFVPVA
jgi:hypothetical protein